MENSKYFCVILAGGTGARLWPLSRQHKPKQFIDFFGTGSTLLQTTYERYAKFMPAENIIVMSNHEYGDIVREQLPMLDERNLLLEPMRRNTTPSVAWAALEIVHRTPDACMLVTPCDQAIRDEDQLQSDILHGLRYASNRPRLLTLGILPTRPETAYGYIQMGAQNEQSIFEVKSFTEKPEAPFAELFVQNKEFLWNTGLFISGARSFLQALESENAVFKTVLQELENEVESGLSRGEAVEKAFSMSPSLSLEQGLLERVDNVDVMMCHFDWTDIGTWQALYAAMPKNAQGNVVLSDRTLLYDCKDCLVEMPSDKVVLAQGLNGYMIVESGKVLVVCKKDDERAIRNFLNDVQINLGDEFV